MTRHPPEDFTYTPSSSQEDDDKAGYDDLIDEYAAPYTRQSQHKTYTIQPQSLSYSQSTRRDQSFPVSLDNSSSSDLAYKPKGPNVSTSTDWGYPPTSPAKEPETRTIWQRVYFAGFMPISY